MSEVEGLAADVSRRRLALDGAGVEIALLDWGGDGPLALLHHANGFCAALWAPVAEALRDRYRVVAMDARGHGDSSLPADWPAEGAFGWLRMAGDVRGVAEALLAETGHEQIALGLGHSFGGTLTLCAECDHPGLYERIVLVDPVLREPEQLPPPGERPKGHFMAVRARRRRAVWPSRAEARAYLAGRELFRTWTPRAIDLYVAEGLRDRPDGQVELKCAPEVEAAVFEGSSLHEVWREAPRAAASALLLWASRGDFPRAAYERMAGLVPHARVETLEAGHLVVMESPDLVVDAVRRFAG